MRSNAVQTLCVKSVVLPVQHVRIFLKELLSLFLSCNKNKSEVSNFSPFLPPKQNLLGHPLCMALGRHKWMSFGRYVYYFTLGMFLMFVLALTDFLVQSVAPYSAKHINEACKTFGYKKTSISNGTE